MRYYSKNVRPFTAVCQNEFGREVIYTNKNVITTENIVEELNRALPKHRQNAIEIEYLDRYYRGDQPILYRNKAVRPEINNKIVENLASFIVKTKTSAVVGEPIQYVLRGTEEVKSEEVTQLNRIMESEDKQYYDVSLCEWRSICGTAYRYIGTDDSDSTLMDESGFFFSTENPMNTFVVYHNNNRPAFSVQIREDENNEEVFHIYTNSLYMLVKGDKVVQATINGNGAIPVIEYPNNERRISDIELTIQITDQINLSCSDRANSIEGFVASWIKFVNCEIDPKLYAQMRQEGVLTVKSNNGSENKADVDVMTQELNQTQTQVAVGDLYDRLLVIQGIANREGNTGGDTGSAVFQRNGGMSAENMAKISEPIFKRAERMALRIILNRLRINQGFSLLPSDIEIHIARSMNDNMMTKAETLQILLSSGVYPPRALKTVGLFSDPEQVAVESKDRMDVLYPTEIVEQPNEVIEVEE